MPAYHRQTVIAPIAAVLIGSFRHYAASLAIITDDSTWHMIDATPDFREQLYSMQKAYPEAGIMNSIILTHAHAGHFIWSSFLRKRRHVYI